MELTAALSPDLHAPARARKLIEPLAAEMEDEVLDDLRLLVNEVVTNCVKHAGLGERDSIELKVNLTPRVVNVQVFDQGCGFVPDHPKPKVTDTSGRGLFLLEAMADSWGVVSNGSTCVWFELVRPR